MVQALGAQADHRSVMLLDLWELAACGLLCKLLCVTAVGGGGSGQPGHNRVAAASSDLGAGVAAHRARGQGVRDAELRLLGGTRSVHRVDARLAEIQRKRRVGARLRAQVAADRAQGRSARPGWGVVGTGVELGWGLS